MLPSVQNRYQLEMDYCGRFKIYEQFSLYPTNSTKYTMKASTRYRIHNELSTSFRFICRHAHEPFFKGAIYHKRACNAIIVLWLRVGLTDNLLSDPYLTGKLNRKVLEEYLRLMEGDGPRAAAPQAAQRDNGTASAP
jgi:hypothetical protein